MEPPPASVSPLHSYRRKAGFPATQNTNTLQDWMARCRWAGVIVTGFADSYITMYIEKVTLHFTYKETPGTAL